MAACMISLHATAQERKVLLSESRINYALYARLVDAGASLVDAENPTVYRKAVKNAAELENLRRAHIKDAVAMVRFMRYLKDNIGKIPMTEISASDYLESLRRAQEGNLGLSFDTICGYGPHRGTRPLCGNAGKAMCPLRHAACCLSIPAGSIMKAPQTSRARSRSGRLPKKKSCTLRRC